MITLFIGTQWCRWYKSSSQPEGQFENIDNIPFFDELVNQIQASVSLLIAESRDYAECSAVSQRTSGEPNSINITSRRPTTPGLSKKYKTDYNFVILKIMLITYKIYKNIVVISSNLMIQSDGISNFLWFMVDFIINI